MTMNPSLKEETRDQLSIAPAQSKSVDVLEWLEDQGRILEEDPQDHNSSSAKEQEPDELSEVYEDLGNNLPDLEEDE